MNDFLIFSGVYWGGWLIIELIDKRPKNLSLAFWLYVLGLVIIIGKG